MSHQLQCLRKKLLTKTDAIGPKTGSKENTDRFAVYAANEDLVK